MPDRYKKVLTFGGWGCAKKVLTWFMDDPHTSRQWVVGGFDHKS
jgi:hypothetical protein